MDANIIIVSGVVLTLLISVTASLIRSKGNSNLISFFYADKKLRVSQVTHLLLSSSFAMNGLLYQTYLGFKIGWASIFLQVVWCLSYILLSLKASKVKKLTKDGTLHSAISDFFGSTAGRFAAIATILGFVIQIGWELIVGISVFGNSFTNNTDYSWWLILIITGICVIYTIFGGLKGSVFANIIQNWIGITALILICIFLMFNYHPTTNLRPWDGGSIGRMFSELGIGFFITNALFSIFWQFVDFSAWQNLASGDGNQAQTKASLYWSSLWILFFPGVVGTIAGMYLRGTSVLDANNLFPYIITLLSNHKWLLMLTVMGCVSAMLSTIDGLLLASSQAAIWDLIFPNQVNNKKNTLQQKKLTVYSKILIIVFGIIGSAFIYYITIAFEIDIFNLVYLVTIAQMVLVPVVLLLLFSKAGNRFKFGSLSIGLGLFSGLFIVGYGIYTNSTSLMSWSPTICLGISCFPQLYNITILNKNAQKV
jgi:Na+/proline symporter